MLLKRLELEAIKSGDVSLVFRRWRRPSVKTGGTLKTAVGVLAIDRIVEIKRSGISGADAAAAGYVSLSELLDRLDTREGDIYRIEVHFAGADPRIQLREDDALSNSDLEEVQSKLGRLDSAARTDAWTLQVLRTIEQNPMVAAAALAEITGYKKDWLKTNIRKLKNLGLTMGCDPLLAVIGGVLG